MAQHDGLRQHSSIQLAKLAVRKSILVQSSSWQYIGTTGAARVAAFTHPLPHVELAGALQRGLRLECFHREERQDDSAYKRAVFCGRVRPQLFDWFFNASTGYRGAFFKSADEGTQANRALLDRLTMFLTDWAIASQHDPDRQWVLASLTKPSAKAWLAEYPGHCAKCAGEWSPSYNAELQIENARWEWSSHVHAAWGRQAPWFSKIRIFGGFIDAQGSEWLAPHKEGRATHIWEHGWS